MFFKKEIKKFIPYSQPDIGDEEINAVINVMKSKWITTGPKTIEFEQEFKEFLNDELECIAINSATAGLHLCLEALNIQKGDEVITTTHTFTATAEVIRYLGATPVFVDIDENSICIDHTLIEEAITPKTKCIIPVHFAGLSANLQKIKQISQKYNIPVVEDAAHAITSSFKGIKIGCHDTKATVFSFYANKGITTAEGGMIVTRDKDLAKRTRIMRCHGIDKLAYDRFTSNKKNWAYDVIAPGFKYNLTDIASAIGIVQLKRAYELQSKRKRIADIYNKEFSNLPIILPPKSEVNDIHAWHLYMIRIREDSLVNRDECISKLQKFNIGTSVHYIPLHFHTYWKEQFNLIPENYPVSTNVYENCLSLPIYSSLNDNEISYIIDSLKKVFF